jgi:hypothetical protein
LIGGQRNAPCSSRFHNSTNLTPWNLCKGESVRLDSLRQRGCSASAGALDE